MNKNLDRKEPRFICISSNKKSRGISEIFKILEVKRSFIKNGREVGQLCANVEFP